MTIAGLDVFSGGLSGKDERGEFYCSLVIGNLKTPEGVIFKEWDFSYNKQNVLRGMHCDFVTWKLVECIQGKIFWAGVDARRSSGTFKNTKSLELSRENHTQVLIPPGVLAGFYVATEEAIVYYRQSEEYSGAERQLSVRWDDPALGIGWPCNDPILSPRDRDALSLEEAMSD